MTNTGWSIIAIIAIIAIAGPIMVGCGSMPLTPSLEVRPVWAPTVTGTLGVGLSFGALGQILRDTTSGKAKAVGCELLNGFVRRLGAPFEPIVLGGNVQVLDAMKSRRVDVASAHATPARAKDMDFPQSNLDIATGFLVEPRASAPSLADADRAGLRVGATLESESDARVSQAQMQKRATLVSAATLDNAIAMPAPLQLDAFATNKTLLLAIPSGSDLEMVFLRFVICHVVLFMSSGEFL